MHRATVLERKVRPAGHAPKGPLPHKTALHFSKPAVRHSPAASVSSDGAAVAFSAPSRRTVSDDSLPCRGADCCVWGDLAVALLFLALFGLIVYVHALLPAPHP